MYDVRTLNEQANMKELYEKIFGNELKYRSHQWEGPCPVCGGNDRFYIADKEPHAGNCRQCGLHANPIRLVQIGYNIPSDPQHFRQAVDKLASLLNYPPDADSYQRYTTRREMTAVQKPVRMIQTMPNVPPEEWRREALKALMIARDYLWRNSGDNREMEYLLSRGFTGKTIHDYCIGYNPKRYSMDYSVGGEQVTAHTGYYIPSFMRIYDEDIKASTLMRIKVRPPDYVREHYGLPKYIFIKGGEPVSLFCAQYARPINGREYPNIIYVEGEFDAMTINQVAGDICRAVTFGSHDYIGEAEQWQSWYRIPDRTVICFDNDSDPMIMKAVRKDEEKLQQKIIKAQSLDDEQYRAEPPVIRHLPEEYHDWNDILKLPNGTEIIRNKLSEWFTEG